MNLKEFISETISGIIDATTEVQNKYAESGVVVNPPVTTSQKDLFRMNDDRHTYRRVELVEFDVAVTAESESTGGKVGLKVLSIEASVEGKVGRRNEEASRVRFTIPIVLSPANVEIQNRQSVDDRQQRESEAQKQKPPREPWIDR